MSVEPNPIERIQAQIERIERNQRGTETLAANAPESHLSDLRLIWRGMEADKRALEAHLKGLTSDQHPN